MKTNKLLLATLAVLFSVHSYAQTIDEIVDKHVTAMGGLDKISAINTLVMERSLAVSGMEIPMVTQLVVGKSIRNESTVMGNKMIQVVDNSKGWMIRPTMMGGTGEPEDMPADQLKQQMSSLDPFGGLINYKVKGNKAELIGKEKSDKKDVFHVKLTTKDGQVIDEYLDATTFLISKIKTSFNGEDGEITFGDYKDIEGVKFANTMDVTNVQMGILTFITKKVTINSKIDDSVFKRP